MPNANPLYLGLEIGGTKLQLGLGRGDGRILAIQRRVIRPESGAGGILQQIQDAYPALLSQSDVAGESPTAAGIGFGGPVDADEGRTLRSHQVDGWDNFNLVGWASETLNIPQVAIRNDADTAGLGEARQGAGVGLSPIFYVTIGSGIGGGLILDGQIYRGSGAGAAEIGHLWIDDVAGGPRKLEDIASGWAIGRAGRTVAAESRETSLLEAMSDGNPSRIDGQMVARAALDGDPVSLAILSMATRAVGLALAHVVTLLAPRRIILGGGVSMIGETLWFEPIRKVLESRAFPLFGGTCDLVPAALGEEVVLHGAFEIARTLMEDPLPRDA
jgi:glucokinase